MKAGGTEVLAEAYKTQQEIRGVFRDIDIAQQKFQAETKRQRNQYYKVIMTEWVPRVWLNFYRQQKAQRRRDILEFNEMAEKVKQLRLTEPGKPSKLELC